MSTQSLPTTDSAPHSEVIVISSLDTVHLYFPLSPTVTLLIVNVLVLTPVAPKGILFPILIHWYIRLSVPLALHVRVTVVPTGASTSLGSVVTTVKNEE